MQHIHFKIYPLDRNVDKLWFVEYKHPATGKYQKKYGHLKRCSNLRDKLIECDRIIEEVKISLDKVPSKTDPYPGLDVARLVQLKFEERSIYLKLKSISTYRTKVIEFVKWYRVSAFKPEVVAMGIGVSFIKYLKESNRSNTTINAYRNTLKTLFRGLKKIIPENPFEETTKLKERRKSYKYFDESMQEEMSNWLKNEDPELWLACQCQFYLLLRPNELRTIKVGAFNIRSATVRIEGDISKTSNTQFITIPDEFIKQLQFIDNYPPHFYLFGRNSKPGPAPHGKKYFPTNHQQLLIRHGIPTRDYKFYSWKHTGAVMYYTATGDVKGLKEQGRWHSLDMVNEYLKNLGVLDIDRVKVNFPKIGSQINNGSGLGDLSRVLD